MQSSYYFFDYMTEYEVYIFNQRKESFFDAVANERHFLMATIKDDPAISYEDMIPVIMKPKDSREEAFKSIYGRFIVPVLFSDMTDLAFLFASGQLDRLKQLCETKINQYQKKHGGSVMEIEYKPLTCPGPQYSAETSAKFAEYKIKH